MVEQREIENAKLQKFAAQAEAEADAQLAERKKNIEEAYKLKLFNLRAILEAVKMKPDERQAVENSCRSCRKSVVRRLPSCRRKNAVWLMPSTAVQGRGRAADARYGATAACSGYAAA